MFRWRPTAPSFRHCINPGAISATTNGAAMHNDRDPSERFPTPIREPKLGTFHRPVHGFGAKRAPAAAELRLSGPMTGEQKLGEGLRELPLVGKADVARTKGET